MQIKPVMALSALVAASAFALPAPAQVTCVPKPAGGYDCMGSVGNAPLAWPSTVGPGPVAPLPSGGGNTAPAAPLLQSGPTPPAVTVYEGANTRGNAVPQTLPPPRQAQQPAGPLGGSSYGVVRPVPGGGFATYDIPSGQIGGAVPMGGDGGYFYYRP
ncbi:MAG: hypothetical protein ACREUW_14090 [Burkholderiales bacterium]